MVCLSQNPEKHNARGSFKIFSGEHKTATETGRTCGAEAGQSGGTHHFERVAVLTFGVEQPARHPGHARRGLRLHGYCRQEG